MSMRHQPSSSMLDMYSSGCLQATSAVHEASTPAAASVRLALDRQRLLLSLRHCHPPPTVSAPTAAATSLLDPSAFCLATSSTSSSAQLMENWNALRHQSHHAVVPGWTSGGVGDFASYMQYSAMSGLDVRRKNATRESTSTLKAWLFQHIKNPYPTKGEKIMLAIFTRMTLTQVSTWFANARRRLKKENKMQWSPRQRAGDEDDDDMDDVNDDVTDDDDDDVTDTRHDVTADSDEDVTSSYLVKEDLLGDGEHGNFVRNADDVTKPSVDSAFSLPPSRTQPPSAEQLPVPVAARLRDDNDRSTKPRIWSLAEVATSVDYRPKRADRDAVAAANSAEFRPWSTTAELAAPWKSTEPRPGAWQTAFVSTTSATRWHRNDVETTASRLASPTELLRPTT